MWLVSGERASHKVLWCSVPRPPSSSWGFCGVGNTRAAFISFVCSNKAGLLLRHLFPTLKAKLQITPRH